LAIASTLCAIAFGGTAEASSSMFISVGNDTRPPIGWVDFCGDNPMECEPSNAGPREVTLTPRLWKELVRINSIVNEEIRPLTDLDHYGMIEKWTYPDDGYGDCEDYVLLKQRRLTDAGWPRQALLITVVREMNGDGHAVLTVRTDRGEFILDNQNGDVRLWSETNYRYVKRQSQLDPNLWVSLGDPRPTVATATSR
jgi:predicted transglutaminase-like cysteine proteinase